MEPEQDEGMGPVPTQEVVPYRERAGTDVAPAEGEVLPYQGAGTFALTDKMADTLLAPFPTEAYEVKPTGEIYIPQIYYRRRLNLVFGPGGWALIPMSEVKVSKTPAKVTVVQKWHLVADGRFIAEAWGEGDYYLTNQNATTATAIESAKSTALMRCCKDLGIASECWDPKWTATFKGAHCVNVNNKWALAKKGA